MLNAFKVLLDALFQPNETMSVMLLQYLLCSCSPSWLAQISAIVLEVVRNLVVGTKLAHETKDVIPVVGLGKAKDTLVFDIGVYEGGDVETCSVLDIDEPFWKVCQSVIGICLQRQRQSYEEECPRVQGESRSCRW